MKVRKCSEFYTKWCWIYYLSVKIWYFLAYELLIDCSHDYCYFKISSNFLHWLSILHSRIEHTLLKFNIKIYPLFHFFKIIFISTVFISHIIASKIAIQSFSIE